MDITFVNGNNSWKFHDDTTLNKIYLILWQEHSEKRVTDRQTEGRTDGQKEVFLELLGRS